MRQARPFQNHTDQSDSTGVNHTMRFHTLLPLTFVLGAAVACVGRSNSPADIGATATPIVVSATKLMDSSAYVAVTDNGPYPGFDTSEYPGDAAMEAWRASGEFHWVGFYLPAPCHKDTSWSGKRDTLEAMGWGTAVIYVGQQTWGRKPRRTRTLGDTNTCSSDVVGAERGRIDAADAIATTEREGFPRGTMVFLDIEHMNSVPESMRDYYRAWTAVMLADGRYRPGYYAHNSNAEIIYGDVQAVFQSFGKKSTPVFWVAGGSDFSPDRSPNEVGHTFAGMWQGVLDIVHANAGVRIPIDVSVGMLPSPSSAAYIAVD